MITLLFVWYHPMKSLIEIITDELPHITARDIITDVVVPRMTVDQLVEQCSLFLSMDSSHQKREIQLLLFKIAVFFERDDLSLYFLLIMI